MSLSAYMQNSEGEDDIKPNERENWPMLANQGEVKGGQRRLWFLPLAACG